MNHEVIREAYRKAGAELVTDLGYDPNDVLEDMTITGRGRMSANEVPTELVEAIAPYVLDGDLHKARRALAAVLPLAYAEAIEHVAKRISPNSGIGLADGATRGDVAVWQRMSVLDKILTAFGLQHIDTAAKEHAELDRLRSCTTSDEQYLATLHQAVIIAQCGGITDEKLEALMHLGVTGMMLQGTEEALHGVGIDTRPWREVEAEWRA